MGVTVHFEGRVADRDAYAALLRTAIEYAKNLNWPFEEFAEQEVTLQRVREEEEWDYTGPVEGVVLHPHERCDPLRFEFDKDLYVQEYCKTQFAGSGTHVQVIELLRTLAPHFVELAVEDEGEYLETDDLSVLERHLVACDNALDDLLKQEPQARGPVKLANGRIIDVMS